MSKTCGHWAWCERGTSNFSPFFCGRPTCQKEKCRTLFWSRRVRLVTSLIKRYDLVRFFTLTLNRGVIPPNRDPWDYVHEPWAKFRHIMRRHHDGNFKFVAILEAHKNKKYPHIHGFTNIWMTQKKWSSFWEGCGGGHRVWIEKIKDGNPGKYVNKSIEVARYVGKENLTLGYKEKGRHRTLWRSQNLKADFELDKEGRYGIIKEHVYKDDGTINPFFVGRVYYGSEEEWKRQEWEKTRMGKDKETE